MDEDAIKAMESKNKFILRGRTLQLDSAVIKPRKDRRNAEDSATMTQPEPTPVENLVEDKNEKVPSKVVTKEITEAPAKTAKVSPKTAATVKPVTNTEATEPKDETATGDQKSPTPSTSVSRSLKYVAFGLPETINKKDFKKVSSKACRKAEIAPINQTDPLYESIKVLEPPGKIFLMSIPSRKNIEKLVDFFKTTTTGSFESSASEGTAAARKGGKKIQLRSMADVTELHLRKKKCRLILRNLSFQATEQNILDRLSQFGPIVDVMIPKVEVQKTSKRKRRQSTEDEEETQVEADNITKLQPRGFGFITFLCARDAIAAVEAGTGIKICNREVAVDFCASKAVHDKILKGGFATNPYSVDSDLVNADVEPKQVIDEDEVDDNDDNDADVDAEDEENDDGEMDDNDEDEDEDDENDDADDEDNDEDEQETETEKPKVSDAAEMKTVFLRELAFDSTEKDIRDSLRVFGKISLAILVKGKYLHFTSYKL